MKILIVGKLPGRYSKLWSYKKSFISLGHDVQTLNLDNYFNLSKLNRALNWILDIPRYFGIEKANLKLIEKANDFKPDLIFLKKPNLIKPSTVSKLKSENILLFSWTSDSIFYKKNVSKNFLKSLSLYDCNFFQNKLNIPFSERYNSKKSKHLYSSFNENIHYPIKVEENEVKKWGADIVFIGTYSPNEKRGKWLEKLCGDGYNIKVYGNRWHRCLKCSCLRKNKNIAYEAFYGKDFSRIISSSKIIINFLREHNKDSHNSRTFEIPACKGFMLHEKVRKEATSIFEDGEEAVFFDSYKDLKNKIDYFLENNKERKKIANNGYKRSQVYDCSFKARAEKIIKTYYSLKK